MGPAGRVEQHHESGQLRHRERAPPSRVGPHPASPYRPGADGSREQVIEKYKAWLLEQPHLLARLPELRGRRLGCWCAPLPCHAQVLAELADEGAGRCSNTRDRRNSPLPPS
ncbi:MAG: DUF4326 domain-containing protein [Pseudonocardia sp.]|nr:DUF4326 domain-containing protein [Pseudonocardia sp.]MBO0874075.1 DUF4326 domain-containing protein [Pseudonocardia sp.]